MVAWPFAPSKCIHPHTLTYAGMGFLLNPSLNELRTTEGLVRNFCSGESLKFEVIQNVPTRLSSVWSLESLSSTMKQRVLST
jgi:hypothetical protein